MRLFVEINERGTTVVLATHDPTIIHREGNRVIVLERGQIVRDRILRGPNDTFGVRGDSHLPAPGAVSAEPEP